MYRVAACLACAFFGLIGATNVWADEDPSKQTDVTQLVVGQLKDNKLAFTANNDLFGDPANGEIKALRIVYQDGDKTITTMVLEDHDVNIQASAGQTITVKKAVYGVLEGSIDVKDKVVAAVSDNALSISVDNDTLGGDPANGIAKQLSVTYAVDGASQTVTAPEGQTLTIAKPADGKTLAITAASYGPAQQTPATAP